MSGQIKYIFLKTLIMTCLLGLLLSNAPKASAGCETALSLIGARRAERNNSLFAAFAFSTNWNTTHKDLVDEAELAGNWSVISPTLLQKARKEPNPNRQIELFRKAVPNVLEATAENIRFVRLRLSEPVQEGEIYLVNVAADNTLISADCVGNAFSVKIPLPPSANNTGSNITGGQSTTSTKKKFVLEEVKKREDADIYVEGIAEGAKKAKTAFTVDASVSKKFLFNSTEPEYFWKPFFNIKASTSEKADPNSLNFGVNFENPTGLISKNIFRVNRIYFTEAAKFEADRDFKSVNFVGDFRMKIDSKLLNTKHYRQLAKFIPVAVIPFIGMEIGKNLKSPVDEIKGKLIARPLFGANLYAVFYQFNEESGYKKTLTFEMLYERRLLLKKEIALDTDDDGSFIGVPLTRTPRDYVKSSLTFDFAKNFGFKLNYEYGSLPPLFKLVDNKFSVGLVFKGIFSRK
jgi:hypothetical protein